MTKPRSFRTRIGFAATAVALIAAPAAAAEVDEALVPPSNSAATQYTEAFPTPAGDRKTDGREGRSRPAEVLGRGKVRKLGQEGRDGRAVAAVTAATAPESAAPAEGQPAETGSGDAGGATSTTRGGGHPAAPAATRPRTPSAGAVADLPEGSSGIGEVVGQATGLSSAGQSVLLLLAILATIVWAVAYRWRQRQRIG